MKFSDWLRRVRLDSLKINAQVLEVELSFTNVDRLAAWELYVELLTRTTTQPLSPGTGDEKTALNSVYAIFALTRETLKKQGPGCIEFAKVAVVVLNQVIRPFTSRWHLQLDEGVVDADKRIQFRSELADLQVVLSRYTQALSDIAGVEDLTYLEDAS